MNAWMSTVSAVDTSITVSERPLRGNAENAIPPDVERDFFTTIAGLPHSVPRHLKESFMIRRALLGLFALILLIAATVSPRSPAAARLAAQAPSTVTPAQAAPYLGEWTANVTSPMGPGTYTVEVKVEGGQVTATISSSMLPPATASEISRSGSNLFLKYTNNFQGMSIPGLLALTPTGQDMFFTISMMDGQFEMAARATRGAAPSVAAAGQAGRGGAAQAPAGPPPPQPQVARVTDLMQMMSALPDEAPATPKQPRRVLVLAKAAGFVHASIPLAARTIEALGEKTGAWTTVITYDPADINAGNLTRYDAIFLAGTTGTFLDDPTDPAVTAARRQALLDFVRGGKGLAGIHAAVDSYHGGPSARPTGGGSPAVDGGKPLWPDFNRLIGGYFKWHWLYPTKITVRIDDPSNPVDAPFTSKNAMTGVRLPRPVLGAWTRSTPSTRPPGRASARTC